MYATNPLDKSRRYNYSMRTIDDDIGCRGANHPDIVDHHRKMDIIERGGQGYNPLYRNNELLNARELIHGNSRSNKS
jgi:hypothetical protein